MKNRLMILSLLTLVMTAHSYATEITPEQQNQILNKCKKQAAKLAHKVDENSKERDLHTEFKSSKILRIDGGTTVTSEFELHWHPESFDASDFTVVMVSTLGNPCELESIVRH